MNRRSISKICMLFFFTYLSFPLAWGGEFLINGNLATAKSLTPVIKELSDQGWLGVDFVGGDFYALTSEEGTALGKALVNNLPEYFTLQVHKAGRGQPEGLAALFEQIKDSKAYYVIKSHFDADQGNILGSVKPRPPMFGEIVFDDPASFAAASDRTIADGFSVMNNAAAQVLIDDTADFSSIHGLSWANNGNQLSSDLVIQALEKIAANPPPRFRGLDFSNSMGVTDEIAPSVANLLQKFPTQSSFSFDFSRVSGQNSNNLVGAVIENLPNQLSDMNNAFRFNHGNLSNFPIEWWTFFLNNSSNLYFADNDLGTSMQTLAEAFQNRPSSTNLWLDLSANNIDDDGAIIFFEALGNYLDKNHPTDSFYFAFGGNPLGDRGMDALVGFFQRFGAYVKDCPWNQVQFNGSQFSSANWIKLLDALKGMDLSSISLNDSDLSDPAVMGKLGELIFASPKIWFAEAKNTKISDDGIAEFAKAMTNVSHFPSYLWLQDNAIGREGAQALAASLKSVKAATNINLYLNRNNIDTEGALALIDTNKDRAIAALSLGENSEIDVDRILPLYAQQKGGTINLSMMGLTDEQAVTLAEIIRANPVFESLIVSENKIGDRGMLALGMAFVESLKAIARLASSCERLDLERGSYKDFRPKTQIQPAKVENNGWRCAIQ